MFDFGILDMNWIDTALLRTVVCIIIVESQQDRSSPPNYLDNSKKFKN